MKTFRNTKLLSMLWLFAEVIVFLVLYFTASNKTLSTTFFGLITFDLLVILLTWGSFKLLNSQVRRNAVKKSSTDKTLMQMYLPDALPNEKGVFKDEMIIKAKRKRGWSIIGMSVLPTIFALTISLVFAL